MSRMVGMVLLVVGAAAAVFAVACSGTSSSAGADAEPSARLEIASRNLRFDKRTLVALPNTDVTIVHNNRDGGTPHNIAFYEARNARDLIFRGELFNGVETREETFRTPGPGTYFFRCDAHPDTMSGTLVVKQPEASATQ